LTSKIAPTLVPQELQKLNGFGYLLIDRTMISIYSPIYGPLTLKFPVFHIYTKRVVIGNDIDRCTITRNYSNQQESLTFEHGETKYIKIFY